MTRRSETGLSPCPSATALVSAACRGALARPLGWVWPRGDSQNASTLFSGASQVRGLHWEATMYDDERAHQMSTTPETPATPKRRPLVAAMLAAAVAGGAAGAGIYA